MDKCQLKARKDDIPKRAGEKSWVCNSCGTLSFSPTKPACPRGLLDNVRAQAAAERERLHLKD